LRAIDLYLLKRVAATTLALTAAGLTVLLLGRVNSLFALLASPHEAFTNVGQLMLYLVPHLLGTALPGAFFIGMLLTFNRLSLDSEIIALMASGWGLHKLLRPLFMSTVILVVALFILLGYIAPYARYAYRSVKYTVTQTTLAAAIREGTFVSAKGLTLYAQHVAFTGTDVLLKGVFIRNDEKDRSTVLTAHEGELVSLPDSAQFALLLRRGTIGVFEPDGRHTGSITFITYRWPVTVPGIEPFRSRGNDPRELTLSELWAARSAPPGKLSPEEVSAEWNMRLVMMASMPILPILAITLGMSNPRAPRRFAIAVGLVIVVVYFQLIGFSEAMVKRGILPPVIAFWSLFAILAAIAVWLYARGASARPARRSAARARRLEPAAVPARARSRR
jgi:lipopolysaccharide export system permease protein